LVIVAVVAFLLVFILVYSTMEAGRTNKHKKYIEMNERARKGEL